MKLKATAVFYHIDLGLREPTERKSGGKLKAVRRFSCL